VYYLLAGDARTAAVFLRETARLMMNEHYDDEGRLVGEVVALAALISAGRGFPEEAARLKGYADTGDAILSIGAPGKRLMGQLDADLAEKLDPSRCDALRRWGSQLASEEAFDRALAALDDVLETGTLLTRPRRRRGEAKSSG
jgi:hypothetical protein